MIDKIKSAEQFLKSLEDPKSTSKLLFERIDVHVLYIINNYSELIEKANKNLKIANQDVVSSSMIIGFLLKSHLDRFDLEECYKNS